MYSGAVAAVVLMFLYYTGDFTGQCKLHEFFISFNMLVCIALSVISIMPKVQVTLNRNLTRAVGCKWGLKKTGCKVWSKKV